MPISCWFKHEMVCDDNLKIIYCKKCGKQQKIICNHLWGDNEKYYMKYTDRRTNISTHKIKIISRCDICGEFKENEF